MVGFFRRGIMKYALFVSHMIKIAWKLVRNNYPAYERPGVGK